MIEQNLQQKLEQKERELEVIYQVAEMITSLDLAEVLREIVKVATELTNADSCLIYLLEHKTDTLILRASKNTHPDVLGKIKLRMGEGITGWVAKEQKPVAISENAGEDPRFKFFANLPEDSYQAFLSVPILNKRGIVGVINIQHKEKHIYSDDDVNLLAAVGKIVGGAVENAMLVAEALELRETLELRKLLTKAKGILMKNAQISEEEAHRRIQKQSMGSGRSIEEIANAILLSERLTT